MPICKKIRRINRKVCIGDMTEQIELNTRSITPPTFGGVDFDEDFVIASTVFAMLKTKIGASVFDQSNTERTVTHFFYIRFDSTVTAETWITFKGNLYDIIDVENLDGRSEFMLLRSVIRGPNTVETNFA